MGIYLIVLFVMGDISVKLLLKRMKVVLLFVCLVGIANPFFDRKLMFLLGELEVTGGMISAVTLMFKGFCGIRFLCADGYDLYGGYLLCASEALYTEDVCDDPYAGIPLYHSLSERNRADDRCLYAAGAGTKRGSL